MTSQEYINKITLEYLGTVLKKNDEREIIELDNKQVNFYKKRLYAAFKQHINALIKSSDKEETLYGSSEDILTEYIDKKIKEFRIDDFSDLQTTDLSNSIISLDAVEDANIEDPNTLLFNSADQNTVTLDDFVIKKTIKTAEPIVYPQQKNIMNKKFRYKGVKKQLK
tara:strand:- start:2391 stop:2891 length:501 start_codon:yes stop_codon:yes gene_type:complete